MSSATDTTKSTPMGKSLAGQTFLVGEHVYVRPVEPFDARHGASWGATIFPRSTEWYETWVQEKMPKEHRRGTYIVVRKADDVPVGSISTWRWEPVTVLSPWVDPLHGERGQQWLAEAMRLVTPWLGDEQHRPNLRIRMGDDQPIVVNALEEAGARLVTRFREQRRTWGGRTDGLIFEYLNPQWVGKLGDPAAITLERSGLGEPRPVPPPVKLTSDPPANAVRVGQRVYLRPLEKRDIDVVALWSRRDTETFWDAGRWMYSAPNYLAGEKGNQKKDPQTHVRFAVCLRKSDELIGTLGLDGVDYVHGFAESESAIFRPEYRGGGYGSEAKHLLFDYAFNTLNLHSIQSVVIFPNTRSAAALRKQGYREAGRMHWAFPSFGTFENFVCFDLLGSDWRQMPRATFNGLDEEHGT
jgi:RimJ/RimL family protein N-acetyltransferase